jgi:hypothetical protein
MSDNAQCVNFGLITCKLGVMCAVSMVCGCGWEIIAGTMSRFAYYY